MFLVIPNYHLSLVFIIQVYFHENYYFPDLCQTEADLQEIIGAVEEPSTKGSVRFGAFVRLVH